MNNSTRFKALCLRMIIVRIKYYLYKNSGKHRVRIMLLYRFKRMSTTLSTLIDNWTQNHNPATVQWYITHHYNSNSFLNGTFVWWIGRYDILKWLPSNTNWTLLEHFCGAIWVTNCKMKYIIPKRIKELGEEIEFLTIDWQPWSHLQWKKDHIEILSNKRVIEKIIIYFHQC